MIDTSGFAFGKGKPGRCRRVAGLCLTCQGPATETYWNRYCSRKCYVGHKAKKGAKCSQCGAVFFRLPHEMRKYCSHKCSSDAAVIVPDVTCKACGKAFHHHNRGRKFCSSECSVRFNRGENSVLYRGKRHADRGATWKERKTAILLRDGNKCQSLQHDKNYVSPRIEKMSVDHIVPYRVLLGWLQTDTTVDPNSLDNLVSLCRKCHTIKTNGIETKLIRGDIIGFRRAMTSFLGAETTEKALMLYGLMKSDRPIVLAQTWPVRVRVKRVDNPKTQGEKHWKAKFTEQQIAAIRDRHAEPRKLLAAEFGTTPRYISSIICGHKWKICNGAKGSRHGYDD